MTTTGGGLSPKIRLYNPNGTLNNTAINEQVGCRGRTAELNEVKLPASGLYTVLVGDCSDTNTGNYNLSVQCFGVCGPPGSMRSQTIVFGAVSNQVLGVAH